MKFTKTLKYSAAALVASLGLVGCGNQNRNKSGFSYEHRRWSNC